MTRCSGRSPPTTASPTTGAEALRALLLCALLAGCAAAPDPAVTPRPTTSALVCDRDYLPAMRELVRGAEKELLIAQWELFPSGTTGVIEDLLAQAADDGVTVRLLLDEDVSANAAAVDRLVARGVDARLDTRADVRVHSKVLVADGRDALVGSTNWSSAAIDFNHECNLRLRDGEGPAYVRTWLSGLLDGVTGRDSPQQEPGRPANALVDDDLLPSLLAHLEAASERVDFTLYATFLQPHNPTAPAMRVFQALVDAQARGVTVRGVAEWSSWDDDNNARNTDAVRWLRERGVTMRWETAQTTTHAKTFLMDGDLQVQSANVSTSGLTNNHEVGAITPEEGPIAAFSAWFEPLWEQGTQDPAP